MAATVRGFPAPAAGPRGRHRTRADPQRLLTSRHDAESAAIQTLDQLADLCLLQQAPLSFLSLLAQAGAVAKFILALLAGFSVLSWAVMWERRRVFRGAESESQRFLEQFRSAQNLTQLRDRAETMHHTPLAAMFRAGLLELGQILPRRAEPIPPARLEVGMRNLERSLARAVREESTRLERGLGFLATTASATPFVGLLGTVWGIMNSFHGIGLAGSANLAVVAPGIAEALVNTAAGLAAAIPALLGYNHFVGRARRLGVQMENFASEFTGRADRLLHLRGLAPGAVRETGS